MSPMEGDAAPDFALPASKARHVSLQAMRGSPFVLYFYPKADTPGCTKEACAFQELLPQLGKIGVAVIGVSKDKIGAIDKFANKYGLEFPLASDETGETIRAYGAWVEKSMYGRKYMGVERATFLIDNHGKIAKIWHAVKIPGHASSVIYEAARL